MNLSLPFDLEIRGKASSSYDATTIDRRLAALAGREDEEARREVAYLEQLREKLAAAAKGAG